MNPLKVQPARQLFTLIVYSENCVGLLNQVSTIFTRRCLNIEDVSASDSSMPDIHKLIITTWSDRPTMEKVVRQIEKRIDVLRVFLYTDDEIIYQEVALYKVSTEKLLREGGVESIIRHHSARIIEMTAEYTVFEKSGHPWETQALFDSLRRFDVQQFVRSGRVFVTRDPIQHFDLFLELQNQRKNANPDE